MVKSIAVFGINRTPGSILAGKLSAHPFRILVLSEEIDDCPLNDGIDLESLLPYSRLINLKQ